MIKVVATRDGFYEKLRKAGDEFTVVSKEQVSSRWMVEVGTEKYEDFMDAWEARGGQRQNLERDKITGERISAGGIPEQLAVALETNRELEALVAELKAENALLKSNHKITPSADPTPADPVDEDEQKTTPAPRTRRRRTASSN